MMKKNEMELVVGLLMVAGAKYAEKTGDDSLFLADVTAEAIDVLQRTLDEDPPTDLGEAQRGKVVVFGMDGDGRALYYLE